MFKDNALEAGPCAFGIVSPFDIINHLLVRLVGALQEAWFLSLPPLRRAVVSKKIEP